MKCGTQKAIWMLPSLRSSNFATFLSMFEVVEKEGEKNRKVGGGNRSRALPQGFER